MKPSLFAACLLAATPGPLLVAEPSGPATSAAAPEPAPPPDVETASLLRIGEAKLAAGDGEASIMAFRQASRRAKDDDLPRALIGLARAYRRSGDGVKAIATYERLTLDHPAWQGTPEALLELGRALRENGAPRLALARFYSVIHGTLKLPEGDAPLYRRLVRTAQFEIAETHLSLGDTAEAARFFLRLDAMDLAPEDRARARFRAAQAQAAGGDGAAAIATLGRMLAQDGDAADAAEARFLLARLHADAGRDDEALRATLDLLRAGRGRADAATWREWQRRAGEFLADRFVAAGDHRSALLVYRALDALDPSPAWRAPVLFQIGVCLERAGLPDEARESYLAIGKLAAGADIPAPALAEWKGRADWRVAQLEWTRRTDERLTVLTAGEPRPAQP